MKRILAAALIFAGAAAWAHDDSSQAAKQESQSERSTSQNWDQMKKDIGLKKDSQEAKTEAKAEAAHSGQHFSINGTIADASNGKVVVRRPGLADAKLKIDKSTLVSLDGAKVEGKKLPKGAAISAQFQLKGNDTVATHVDASLKPLQGTGGSGSMHHDQSQQGMSEHEKHQQQLNEGPRQLQGHTGAAMGNDSQDIPTKSKANKEKKQQQP